MIDIEVLGDLRLNPKQSESDTNDLIIEFNTLELDMGDDSSLNLDMETPQAIHSDDYEKLIHKPKLNGREIIGDIPELDPTVPEWAKEDTKPTYTADEVNAVNRDDEITLEELDEIFEGIFN